MTRRLLSEKAAYRQAELSVIDGHLARLCDGPSGGDNASALFMDILRDFKRINSLATSVAYPILASAGELHETRLACPT